MTNTRSRISVIIPAYRVSNHILKLITQIGVEVSSIYVVDDKCPQQSGLIVEQNSNDERIKVLKHHINRGVGGAVMTGMRAAIAEGTDVIVKLDGDGQMDPTLIPELVAPIQDRKADYVKGNRFHALSGLGSMPPLRIFGNAALSFLAKASTGYWQVFDPTNGFIAIDANVASLVLSKEISKRYFFETDLLARLYLIGAVVEELSHPARYGNETSSLKPFSILFPFLVRHARNISRRLFYTYFLRNFYPASFELVIGCLLLITGLIFSSWNWIASIYTGVARTSGTVVIGSTMLIIGSQCLLAFLSFDVNNYPKKPLAPRLRVQSKIQ